MKTQRDLYLASADHLGDLAVAYAESFADENPDLSRRIIDRVGALATRSATPTPPLRRR